jgi:hypothetical protein
MRRRTFWRDMRDALGWGAILAAITALLWASYVIPHQ